VNSADEIRFFEDVPLMLQARIPGEALSIETLMSLSPGTIIHTFRAAGENVDISVSDQPLAAAELIVIENRLAVRLSDFTEKK
jgi:flagellar motor switch/type III secretory pathway protein FliN